MFLIYAHNDYRKENGSKIIGLYQSQNDATIAFEKCLELSRQSDSSTVDECGLSYPSGWGLNDLPTSGKVVRCTLIDDIIFLILVELSVEESSPQL
jgi:hypothetical protein